MPTPVSFAVCLPFFRLPFRFSARHAPSPPSRPQASCPAALPCPLLTFPSLSPPLSLFLHLHITCNHHFLLAINTCCLLLLNCDSTSPSCAPLPLHLLACPSSLLLHSSCCCCGTFTATPSLQWRAVAAVILPDSSLSLYHYLPPYLPLSLPFPLLPFPSYLPPCLLIHTFP